MNIHPIFVHFPLALLTIYSIIEILRLKRIHAQENIFIIKAFLVIVGTIFASISLRTGEGAEHTINGARQLIEIHSLFASISTYVFGFISILYIVLLTMRTKWGASLSINKYFGKIWERIINFTHKIYQSPIKIVLALIGLISITIAGSLGGAIVYGPETDPFVSFIYHLFF